jgi:FMN phosphatase YigB (HAD superfamily)
MVNMTGTPAKTVFLFDVDNTLLDNDRVTADLRKHLITQVGAERANSYWEMFEAIRSELGYADYLGALQRYRLANLHEPNLLEVSYFLLNYSFANRLYPGSLDAVEHVEQAGPTVILSDGDVVFQPHKVRRSGLHEEFAGRVLIYVHKEHELEDVERRFPAEHYVLVDDKIRILTAVKNIWGSRVSTVFVRQGHYALDPKILQAYPPADITIDRISDLVGCNIDSLITADRPLHSQR